MVERGGGWLTVALVCLVIASGPGCQSPHGDGFKCGQRLDGRDEGYYECTRATEICVCATFSCAARVPKSECDAGYRYVGSPFASSSDCVASEDLAVKIEQNDALKACEPGIDAAVAAIPDATEPDAPLPDSALPDAPPVDARATDATEGPDAERQP